MTEKRAEKITEPMFEQSVEEKLDAAAYQVDGFIEYGGPAGVAVRAVEAEALISALRAVLQIDTGRAHRAYGRDFEAGMITALCAVRAVVEAELGATSTFQRGEIERAVWPDSETAP